MWLSNDKSHITKPQIIDVRWTLSRHRTIACSSLVHKTHFPFLYHNTFIAHHVQNCYLKGLGLLHRQKYVSDASLSGCWVRIPILLYCYLATVHSELFPRHVIISFCKSSSPLPMHAEKTSTNAIVIIFQWHEIYC